MCGHREGFAHETWFQRRGLCSWSLDRYCWPIAILERTCICLPGFINKNQGRGLNRGSDLNVWRWGHEYSSWSSILLLAKLMSATAEGMADCWEARSVTGLKDNGICTGLCDNPFHIKCGLAQCLVSDIGLHGLICICKAILEPSRRTQRRMGLI